MVAFRLATVAAALLAAGASAGNVGMTPMPATTTMGPTTTMAPKYSKYGKYGKYGKYEPPTVAPVTTKAYKAYPYVEEKCTAPKERCAGAPGKPYVEYIGCCGDAECVEMPEMGWGRFCMPKPAPKCHVAGERCAGAEGYEYVEYLGCCGDATCTTDPSMGWGSFCKPGKAYDYGMYPAYTMAPATTMPPAKKYGYGYYPKATMAPATTMPPAKKYGYGYYPKATMAPATTMPPAKKYGYGYYGHGKKAMSAGSTAFTGFGETFGCAYDGTGMVPPLAVTLVEDLTDVSPPEVTAIIQVLTVEPPADAPTCTVSAATFPAADAQALLDSLCATARAAGNVISCKFISIEDGMPVRMVDMADVAARQVGAAVDLTYEIVVDTDDAVTILAAISGVLPAGQDQPTIGSGPEVSPAV